MTGILIASVVSLLAAPAPAKKIAVVAVGPDAAAAGSLQRSLEGALAKQGVTVVPAGEIAPRIPPAKDTPPATPAAEKAVAEAQDAYFANETVREATALKAAANEIDSHPEVALPLRLRYYVTAIAVNLKRNRIALAEDAARQALGMGVQKPPDLDDFPPAVAEFLEAERAKLAQVARVKLEITTVPSAAVLTLDGVERDAATRAFSLYPGRHVVSVRAPGYAAVYQFVDTTQASVTIALPLRVTLELFSTRELSAGDRHTLEQIADASGAEILVPATTGPQGKLRAAIWPRSSSAVHAATADGVDALAEAIVRDLPRNEVAKAPPAPSPAPTSAVRRPPGTPRGAGGSEGAGGVQTDTEVAIAYADMTRTLTGSLQQIYAVDLRAAGPRVRIGVRANGGWMGDAEVTWLQGFSTVDVYDHKKTLQHAKPGAFFMADLGAGYAFVRGERATVGAALVGGFEQFSTGDLPTEQVFSGWSAAHAGAELRGGYDAGPVHLSLRAGAIAPLSWKEAKAGTSGQTPAAALVPRARLGAAWHPDESGKMAVGAELDFEQRAVSFKSAPLDVNLSGGSDAKLTERDLRAAVVFRYAL